MGDPLDPATGYWDRLSHLHTVAFNGYYKPLVEFAK